MRQEETAFNAKVKKELERELTGAWIIKAQMQSLRGFPDFLILHDGKFAVLEGKMKLHETLHPKGRAKLQYYNLKKAEDQGGFAQWITPETFNEVITELVWWFT